VLCADFMEADVNVQNACELFELAPALLDDKEFGLKFIEENMEEIAETDAFLKLSKSRLVTLLEDDELGIDEFQLWQAILKWGKAECKRTERKSDSGDDLKTVLGDLVNLIRFPTMSLEEIAAHVAPSNLLSQDALLDLFKYVSISDEKERSGVTLPFPAKPRGGGFLVKESKILERKHKKDVLKFFGVGSGPGTVQGQKKPKLELLYRGSRDGFAAANFHQKCDGKGPTWTVIKSQNQVNIFGGYTQDSWSGSGAYGQGRAWLFALTNKYGKPVRLEAGAASNNQYNNSSYGPTFGAGHDLHVNGSMKSMSNYCNPSSFRQISTGWESVTVDNTLLAGAYNFTVEELEVYSVKDYKF